jgi:tRNA (Thr-GGU) A37 N-methylase
MSATSWVVEAIGRVEGARSAVEDDFWGSAESTIALAPGFGPEALAGLDTYSHVEVIFLLDRVDPAGVVRGARHPRGNAAWPAVGIFAQRAKNRPNRIAATICRVVRVEGTRLVVSGLDAIDGTPVLDLKPVLREFLPRGEVRQPAWADELMRHYWSEPGER